MKAKKVEVETPAEVEVEAPKPAAAVPGEALPDDERIKRKLNNREVLYAFLGWLTTRPDEARFGRDYNSAIAVPLIEAFAEANDLDEMRPDYHKTFQFPEG